MAIGGGGRDGPMSEKRKYDSTVARIAGNILGHLLQFEAADQQYDVDRLSETAVMLARAIVAEVIDTEPVAEGTAPHD